MPSRRSPPLCLESDSAAASESVVRPSKGELGLTGLHELSDGAAESFANGKSSVKLYYEYYAPPTSGVPMKISDHARELLGKNPNNSLPPLPDDDDEDFDYDDEDFDD